MQKIVIDANIITKWFIAEEYSDMALTIRDQFVEGKLSLIAPDLLGYEVLNALKYSKLFPIADLKDAAAALDNYGIIFIPFKGEFAQKAVEIAIKYDITIYDAAYIGLSLFLNIHVYSADKKLISKLKKDIKDKMIFISDINSQKLQ